ncbi:hypothetical protein GCM10008019_45510 [Deinococcus soli (ex Cha et al. 2016)]|nr:hypothetical protein GCM10008019_45510 [Deinococcus soli (ex Cha et al. 2016)]
MVTSWPPPRGVKVAPARWVGGDAPQFRAFFEAVLRDGGEDALARIWNDAPRGPGARLTRWFCPGVPMHASGEPVPQRDGRTRHGFLVPARAALLALERGLVVRRVRPVEDA